MKLLQEQLPNKNTRGQLVKSIVKVNTQPRRLSLRTRSIRIFEAESPEFCDNEEQKDHQIPSRQHHKTASKDDQSPQKLKSNIESPEERPTTAKKTFQQVYSSKSNLPSEDDIPQSPSERYATPVQRKRRQCRPPLLRKVMHCQYFKQVNEKDFILYFGILTKKKMYSTLLINEYGQVIFADRLGSEHFEGSLNNFARNPIYSTILEEDLNNFFEKVSWIDTKKRNTFKVIIYSKNSKRRYSKKATDKQLTNSVIFNRYLRCVSCEIKPIRITISSTEQFQGYWNHSLIEQNIPVNCFLLTSRLSKDLPNLERFNLKKDRKIEKFLRYTKKKQAEKVLIKQEKKSLRRDEMQQEKELSRYFEQKDSVSGFVSHKELENIMIEMNDQNKYSKSALTRGCVLNSGGGKCLAEEERI